MAEDLLTLHAQHVTVDIHPAGVHAEDRLDVAFTSTTFLTADDGGSSELARLLPTPDVEVVSGHLVIARERIELERTEAGFRFATTLPVAGTALTKGGDFSIVVLLPRSEVGPDLIAYEPVLSRYTTEPSPQVFDGKQHPLLGGRTAVVWDGVQDPDVDLEYWYRQLSQGGR